MEISNLSSTHSIVYNAACNIFRSKCNIDLWFCNIVPPVSQNNTVRLSVVESDSLIPSPSTQFFLHCSSADGLWFFSYQNPVRSCSGSQVLSTTEQMKLYSYDDLVVKYHVVGPGPYFICDGDNNNSNNINSNILIFSVLYTAGEYGWYLPYRTKFLKFHWILAFRKAISLKEALLFRVVDVDFPCTATVKTGILVVSVFSGSDCCRQLFLKTVKDSNCSVW